MKLIGITQEHVFKREEEYITLLLEEGMDALHIRKPNVLSDSIRSLLERIPSYLHSKIILHDHFDLLGDFHLKGIHLNRRHPYPPQGYTGYVGRSCHDLQDLTTAERLDYRFLSPIFDSISKQGYTARFTDRELSEAAHRGIINSSVIALGGITPEHLPLLSRYGFGGAALLGYLWQAHDKEELRNNLQTLIRYNSH